MIRERSAGPRMISRLEHKSLVAWMRECVLLICAKPAICMDLQSRYMLWRSAYVSAVWIMVMCSIRDKLCFIHMCSLSLHPYWLSHVSREFFCMVSACIGERESAWVIDAGQCMCMHKYDVHTYTSMAEFILTVPLYACAYVWYTQIHAHRAHSTNA